MGYLAAGLGENHIPDPRPQEARHSPTRPRGRKMTTQNEEPPIKDDPVLQEELKDLRE